jgi:hypothetical protein
VLNPHYFFCPRAVTVSPLLAAICGWYYQLLPPYFRWFDAITLSFFLILLPHFIPRLRGVICAFDWYQQLSLLFISKSKPTLSMPLATAWYMLSCVVL